MSVGVYNLVFVPFRPWGPFREAPGSYRALWAVLFSIKDGSFKSFENGTVKLSAKETKWTSRAENNGRLVAGQDDRPNQF